MFSYDSKFSTVMNKIVDCFYASLLWLLFSLPIVTIGASTTCLFTVVRKVIRNNESYVWRNFISTWKKEWKQSTRMWLVQLGLAIVLFLDHVIMEQAMMQNKIYGVLYYMFYFGMLYMLIWALYTFAYQSYFAQDDKSILKNSLALTIAHFPISFVMLLMLLLCFTIVMYSPFFVFLLPSATVFVFQLFFDRIFGKLTPREELSEEQ